jgi:hypothetical protein
LKYLLDDEQLNGAQSLLVGLRPPRTAQLIPHGDMQHLLSAIELSCQLWGGAATPMIPLDPDLRISHLYRHRLRGAAIDRLDGASLSDLRPEQPLEPPKPPKAKFRDQLGVLLLDEERRDRYRPLTVTVLAPTDPWLPIYAACLGFIPERPSPDLLREGRLVPDLTFERFIDVERVEVVGSADDLLSRLGDPAALSPRQLAMTELAYGMAANTGIRHGGSVGGLPEMAGEFVAHDAGPNILVLCSPGNPLDVALLWNLRAAHGDKYSAPIGMLVDQFDQEFVQALLDPSHIAFHGMPEHSLYVTSTSVSVSDMHHLLAGNDRLTRNVAVVAPDLIARLGPAPSRPRGEVSVWEDGQSRIVPISPTDRSELLTRENSWPGLELLLDVRVLDSPFPHADDVRVATLNEKFFAGSVTKSFGRDSTSAVGVHWPSRLLMLKAVCQERGLTVHRSEPGLACMTLLEPLSNVHDLYYFAHKPLLELLRSMAQRQGTAWAKAHARLDAAAMPRENVAPTDDDLPETDFNKFVTALGSAAAARAWLDWAERRRFIVKGFALQCELCNAKQWVPISGFIPPLACRGCAQVMHRPFAKETVSFKYRLGESLRRVYEHDAMGHLLVLRYFAFLFGGSFSSSLIGGHPGLDIGARDNPDRIGEADVLLLRTDGSCIPIEVKSSFAGADPAEIEKLDRLADSLKAPWSAIAICDSAAMAPEDFGRLEQRTVGVRPHRLVLTYDQLLDPHPVHRLAEDPYAWRQISDEELGERSANFTRSLARIGDSSQRSWFEEDLLYRRKNDED